jgi:CHAD domain-containing protein
VSRRSRGAEIEAPALDGRSRIGEIVRATLVMSVEQIVRSDSRLRAAPDASAIHRARVAVRRLRSNLAAFLPVIEFDPGCNLRERLSWLQDGLSNARDADVLIAGIRRLGESLPDVDRRALENVRRPFDDARNRAYEHVGAMLRDERYISLLRDLVEAAKHPPLNTLAAEPACEAIPALMADAWSTLRKRIRKRSDPPSDSELHAIRIAAKRVRYMAEAISPVAGAVARKLADSAERMQTILGAQHDAVVARQRLRTVVADGDCAFVAGELAACANFAALRARSRWEKAWRSTKRRHRRFKDSFAGRS